MSLLFIKEKQWCFYISSQSPGTKTLRAERRQISLSSLMVLQDSKEMKIIWCKVLAVRRVVSTSASLAPRP